jgi:O-antigen/teichoic acid export membrane protein
MTLIYSFGLWLEGGSILDLWTHGKVEASGPFFLLLILAVGAEMIWSALFIPLAAINQHNYVAYAFVGMGVFGIVSACLGGQAHGLAGVAAPLLLVHGSMIIITGILLWRLRRPVTKQERN